MEIFPVILAGGGGSRLWPLSRQDQPKQFLSLLHDDSLLRATVKRLHGFPGENNIKILCGEVHRDKVIMELHDLITDCEQAVWCEPQGRNTAPAVALACLKALDEADDPILIILPADHLISDFAAFHQCLHHAVEGAKAGRIVTLGIIPDAPETGYGYIESAGKQTEGIQQVKRFVEKPDRETAEGYLKTGNFFWNAGIFVFRAKDMLAQMEAHAGPITASVRRYHQGEEAAYGQSESLSIDYAVMEKTDAAAVVPASFGWSDLGSWQSVYEHSPKDQFGNSVHGRTLIDNCKNSYFWSTKRLVTGIGIEDLVVVETEDAVLVADKNSSQEVRKIAGLAANNRMRGATGYTEHRPWGSFTILAEAEDSKTKRLDVLPGKRTSLQKHFKRNEHWVVVKGSATIRRGDQTLVLQAGEAAEIPVNTVHRIENAGPELLSIIEVQTGSYFGEDDIVRLADDYGRAVEQKEPV